MGGQTKMEMSSKKLLKAVGEKFMLFDLLTGELLLGLQFEDVEEAKIFARKMEFELVVE